MREIKKKKKKKKSNLRTYISRRYVEERVAFSDFLSVKNFMEQIMFFHRFHGALDDL